MYVRYEEYSGSATHLLCTYAPEQKIAAVHLFPEKLSSNVSVSSGV
jgi:hypothetical protein